MQSVDPTLVAYVEAEIIPRYLGFDKAHRPDHVRTVIRESLRLASRCPDADPDLVYAVAAYHDTGLVAGRERHHLVSGQIVSADATLRRCSTASNTFPNWMRRSSTPVSAAICKPNTPKEAT